MKRVMMTTAFWGYCSNELTRAERDVVLVMLGSMSGMTCQGTASSFAEASGFGRVVVSKTLTKLYKEGLAHRPFPGVLLFNPRHVFAGSSMQAAMRVHEYDESFQKSEPYRATRAKQGVHATTCRQAALASKMTDNKDEKKSDAEPSKDDVPDLH